VATVALELFWV